jgi:drug/metabolite transporter (DMT)-like permease
MITLSAASIILYTAPCFVMVMSAVIFKEKITWQKVCALLIAFTGCVMTAGVIEKELLSAHGILLSLAAAFFYALFTIINKIALRNYTPFTVTAYTFGIAGLMALSISDVGGIIALAGAGAGNLLYLVALGLLTIISFSSYTKGLKNTEPSRASIIAFFEPLTASTVGIVVYGEMLSQVKIFGMLLIFASLFILNMREKKI